VHAPLSLEGAINTRVSAYGPLADATGVMPAPDLPEQDSQVLLSVVNGAPSIMQLSEQVRRALADVAQDLAPLTPRLVPELAKAGLSCRTRNPLAQLPDAPFAE
jgi:hypothetical protein